MRILIWTDAFWPEIGGLELFCMRLAVALKERGHDCLVISERRHPRDEGLQHYHGIPVHGVSFYETGVKGNLTALRRQDETCRLLLEDFAPDVIHLNSVIRGALGFILQQRRQRRPALLTLHDHFRFPDRKGLAPAVLQNVDAVVAISDSVQQDALRYDAQLSPRLRLILNALPEPSLPPAPFPEVPRLLAFGRMVRDKGFDLLIRAFAQVATSFPSVTLTLAGEGNERMRLRRMARESNLEERIYFPGWIDPEEIPALINHHNVVIMPSRWREPFGLVLLQAAQMGRPVVASRVGGISEVVSEGVTGLLFENENVGDLAAQLRTLLEDRALGERLGLQAHLHLRKHFHFEDFLSAYERCYAELAARTT